MGVKFLYSGYLNEFIDFWYYTNFGHKLLLLRLEFCLHTNFI